MLENVVILCAAALLTIRLRTVESRGSIAVRSVIMLGNKSAGVRDFSVLIEEVAAADAFLTKVATAASSSGDATAWPTIAVIFLLLCTFCAIAFLYLKFCRRVPVWCPTRRFSTSTSSNEESQGIELVPLRVREQAEAVELHFVCREKPANLIALRAFKGTTYVGSIKPTAKVCWVSFPGKFASGWEALIHYHGNDSVACVFLDDPEHGLGQHHFPDPDDQDRCLCAEIYGERNYKQFGYLIEKDTCTDEEKEKLKKRALAMQAHIVFGEPTEKDHREAKRLWENNKRRASWGCKWFHLWFARVEQAVSLGQRLKVVVFPGKVGCCGKVAWDRLPFADLWDGKGLGGSQKGEVAKLDRMKLLEPGGKWDYEEVDVAQFLEKHFQTGKVVEAFHSTRRRLTRASILQVLPTPEGELKFTAQRLRSQSSFETDQIRHTSDCFQNLWQNCSEESLKNIFREAVGLTVKTISEEQLDDGRPCLQVQFDLPTIGQIKQAQMLMMLRDAVLSKDLDTKLNADLSKQGVNEDLAVDNAQFLKRYSRKLMSFTSLTPQQEEMVQRFSVFPNEHIHLAAPAGCGKTFVALRHVVTKLRTSTGGSIMYICPNRSLIFYFVQWLLIQEPDHEWLQQMIVMHQPYAQFMRVSMENHRIILEALQDQPTGVVLAVFDEAHEVLRMDSSLFSKIEAQQKILLSDVSQSHALHVEYPEAHRVNLTEVVRSTKRVVGGAASFGLQDSETSCLGTNGPPLKTFLFKTPEDGQSLFGEFAEKTLDALLYLVQTYPSLSFEQDVAVIVSSEHFYDKFKPHLEQCLKRRFSPSSQVVSFEESLAWLPRNNDQDMGDDVFILDHDENARGLEKMFVVSVAFDAEITGDSDNSARARLYHSITRAQFQTLVVDQFLHGGWLEFLTTLKLTKKTFEGSFAKAEVRTDAAPKVVDDSETRLAVRIHWSGVLKHSSASLISWSQVYRYMVENPE
eukprot:Skav236423  [mRNA]  locus=scaffold4816:50159:58700:- [translate_table: standard]